MISVTEYKKKLEQYLYKKDVLEYAFKTFSLEYEDRLKNIDSELKRQKSLYKQKLNLTKEEIEQNEKYKGQYKEALEINKKLTTKKGLTEMLQGTIKEIKELEQDTYKMLNKPFYNDYVNYIVYGIYKEDLIGNMLDFIECNSTLLTYIHKRCFYDNSKIDNDWAKGVFNSLIHTNLLFYILEDTKGAKMLFNNLKEKNVKINEKQLIAFIKYCKETQERAKKLENEIEERERNNNKQENETANIIPKRMFYGDTYNILADTEIIEVLKNNDFELNKKVFKQSENKLSKLKQQDIEILDFIVLTLYAQGMTIFTDRNIAVFMYKSTSQETVSEQMLKEVNDSINRLRNTNISEGFLSKELIDNYKVKVEIEDKLLDVKIVRYEKKEKTTYYQLMREPFYLEYAIRTGKIKYYDREIITKDIKGIQHNVKNNTLKQFLTRQIISLNYYKEREINIYEIYDILGVIDNRKYIECRNKTETLLKDLQDNYYNFKYHFNYKKRGKLKEYTSLKISRDNTRPLIK